MTQVPSKIVCPPPQPHDMGTEHLLVPSNNLPSTFLQVEEEARLDEMKQP